MSWAFLARLGRVWGVLWVHFGASEGVWEASWGHLWASWEDLGKVLVSLGAFLRPFWKHFRRIWGVLGRLGQSWRVLGASGACFGRVLERQRASWRRLGAIFGRLGRILEGIEGVLEAF